MTRVNKKVLVFHFGWLTEFYGGRSEAVRRLSQGLQSEIWPEFLSCAKATDDHSVCDCECKGTSNFWGFAIFLARKVEKSAILPVFGWKMMIYWNGRVL